MENATITINAGTDEYAYYVKINTPSKGQMHLADAFQIHKLIKLGYRHAGRFVLYKLRNMRKQRAWHEDILGVGII